MLPLSIKPLTRARWADFEALFGKNGACAGCWCQWCRVPGVEFKRIKGAKAKARMRKRVADGPPPGLLAYEGSRAVGWCALGPRTEFKRVLSARLFKRYFAEDEGVWSAPCLFVAKDSRGQGVGTALLEAAAEHAFKNGARSVEGYPVAPKKRQADAFVWWGTESAFRKARFVEAAQPSSGRRLMRRSR